MPYAAAPTSTDPKSPVRALLFDTFGTVVDWRSSTIRELAAFGNPRGLTADWAAFADRWRGLYQPAMEAVRSGRRPFTILDVLHRESLETLLGEFKISGLSEPELDHLTKIWHRLDPWPDVIAGLRRLKSRYIIGTLSNGNIGLLTRLSKRAGLPFDVILGAETAMAYKPQPDAYIRNAAVLGFATHEVMLVAAHNSDLAAAQNTGMRTAFVARPTEYGPHQKQDFHADRAWDVVTDSFTGLADALDCPTTEALANRS